MRTTQSNFNPLNHILQVFENNRDFLTQTDVEKVKNLLDLGGVHCENSLEILQCLFILEEQGLLTIEEWMKKVKRGIEKSYIITRNN